MIEGRLVLPKMEGLEIKPGVFLMAEPLPIVGTDKLSCLANVYGWLCIIELKLSFQEGGA